MNLYISHFGYISLVIKENNERYLMNRKKSKDTGMLQHIERLQFEDDLLHILVNRLEALQSFSVVLLE